MTDADASQAATWLFDLWQPDWPTDEREVDTLLERFRPRRPGARAFALDRRVMLLETAEGVRIDVALAALPFEIEAIEHATSWNPGPGVALRTCSAEHLVVYKLVAA